MVELLRPRDLAAALALSQAEGWNQTAADWGRMLGLEPVGCFAALEDGRLIGTVTTITYDRALAWIGMMVVHPDHRRRGVGASLMRTALDHLHGLGIWTIKLDATPVGRPLYDSLGFVAEAELERWQGVARARGGGPPPSGEASLLSACVLDYMAYRVDRGRLLERLAAEGMGAPTVITGADPSFGFVMARPGRTAAYIGPLVATTREMIGPLLDHILARLEGAKVSIDLHRGGLMGPGPLAERGLSRRRGLTRMSLGPNTDAATSRFICAIAGPEYG